MLVALLTTPTDEVLKRHAASEAADAANSNADAVVSTRALFRSR
jgi:hypothetical protein